MERIFDGREHRIKSQCPECGHINNVRLQWKEQGATCPECSRVFRAVEHEVELLGAYDLGYGHLGNGISVWNRAQEEHGDYVKIAHIDSDRKVTYYDDKLPGSIKEEIEQFAAKEDPAVSATQLEQKVFRARPC